MVEDPAIVPTTSRIASPPRAAAPAVEGDRLPRQVTEQLNCLLYQSAWRLANSAMGAVVIAAVALRVAAPALVALWFGLTMSVYVVRYLVFRQYRAAPPAERGDRAWSDRHVRLVAVQGLTFGAAGLLMFVTPDLALHLTIVMVVWGLGAGATVLNAADARGSFAFIAAATVPVALCALAQGDSLHIVTGLLVLIFGANLIVTGRNISRSLIQTLKLRHEREELTRALLAEKSRTDLASRAKSDFLATMSHELRTPLNAIIGFSEVMLGGFFGPLGSERYVEYCTDILTSANHLLSLINDILDSAKVEAGKYELHEEPTDLPQIVESSARLMRGRADQKHIAFSLTLGPVPLILADERALRQILLNLLSNAIKFTPEGGRVSLTTGCSESGTVLVEVRDTGIGIPAEDLADVLDNFRRARNAHLSDESGTGLGLPIARGLVVLHGGDLRIASAPGGGTAVTIEFPASRTLEVAA
jgi:two-component system cell cycle sensor histidine kinase PleC